MVLASLGPEDHIDVELAREIVLAVENSTPRIASRRGDGRAATMQIAQQIRQIERFLRALASRRLGLAAHLPAQPARAEVLEALIRDKLAEPEPVLEEEEILHHVRTQLCV